MINPDIKILLETEDKKKADELLLVLNSRNITAEIETRNAIFRIIVAENYYFYALKQLRLYYLENKIKKKLKIIAKPLKSVHFIGGFWVSALLFIIHFQTRSTTVHTNIVDRFGASAYEIVHGKFYLCLTALLLHSNWKHLTGNIAGLIIFGGFVSAEFSGRQFTAWLMIIFSGISGNLFNAFFQKTFYTSIGASTSVFGAIGILAGINCFNYVILKTNQFKFLIPLASGLAIISMIGTGKHADISGHLFGFFSGIPLGMIFSLKQFQEQNE